MKSFVIDELRPADHRKLRTYLDDHFDAAAVGGVYWIPIVAKMLTELQSSHRQCQPFYFALELEPGRLAVELLVRTRSRVRCSCMGYATERQRNWLLDQVDAIFEQLEIKT